MTIVHTSTIHHMKVKTLENYTSIKCFKVTAKCGGDRSEIIVVFQKQSSKNTVLFVLEVNSKLMSYTHHL